MLDQRSITYDIPRPLLTLLRDNGVSLMYEVKLEDITDDGVVVMDKTWKKIGIQADTVVLSLGFAPRREAIEAFRDIVPDVYFIGDCRRPKNIMQATHDAFNVAVEI